MEDDQNRSKRHLAYVGMTSQRLRFKEVQLRSKQAAHSQEFTESGAKQTDSTQMEVDKSVSGKVGNASRSVKGKKKRGRRTKGDTEQEDGQEFLESSGYKGRTNRRKATATEDEVNGTDTAANAQRKSTRTAGTRKQSVDDSPDQVSNDEA